MGCGLPTTLARAAPPPPSLHFRYSHNTLLKRRVPWPRRVPLVKPNIHIKQVGKTRPRAVVTLSSTENL